MKELEVVQVRKRKTAEQPMEQPVKKPDAYDKVVEKAFWFVIGFSVAINGLLCGFRADIRRGEGK